MVGYKFGHGIPKKNHIPARKIVGKNRTDIHHHEQGAPGVSESRSPKGRTFTVQLVGTACQKGNYSTTRLPRFPHLPQPKPMDHPSVPRHRQGRHRIVIKINPIPITTLTKKPLILFTQPPAQIKQWLKTISRTRHWLAEQCGVSKLTVDGWMNGRTIPKPAATIINNLMFKMAPITPRFSIEEYNRIQQAAKAEKMSIEAWIEKTIIKAITTNFPATPNLTPSLPYLPTAPAPPTPKTR